MTAGPAGAYGREEHPWLGRRVTDIASKGRGELTAVGEETVRDHRGRWITVRLAHITPDRGVPWSTAVENVALIP
ncbi:hypothetical protein [Streptomyces sp. NPDC086023]|uniref:hypothetical protein n=1 Tax=Streptomyces sp. NPDC086023 TaxID=3365746 RepID=UPI0037D43E17